MLSEHLKKYLPTT